MNTIDFIYSEKKVMEMDKEEIMEALREVDEILLPAHCYRNTKLKRPGRENEEICEKLKK